MNPEDTRDSFAALGATWREAACVWETLRRLGFAADDLWVMTAKTPIANVAVLSLFVVLKTQGKEFSICAGPVTSEEEAERLWGLTCDLVKRGDAAALTEAWRKSKACAEFLNIATALQAKGFFLPSLVH